MSTLFTNYETLPMLPWASEELLQGVATMVKLHFPNSKLEKYMFLLKSYKKITKFQNPPEKAFPPCTPVRRPCLHCIGSIAFFKPELNSDMLKMI